MSDETSFGEQEINNIAKEIVQAIAMLDYSKKPFRQADIVAHLSQKPGRKNWKMAFENAKAQLDNLGLELVQTKDTSVKSYFVVSKHRPFPSAYKYASEEEISTRILLTLVLGYIFMKNGTVVSDDLLNHLKDLDIYDNDSEHPYFGDVKKKVFVDFVSQQYLSTTKLPDSDLCDISWGYRAEVEVSKKSILEFICQYGFGGRIKPNNLISQYEKAMEQVSQQTTSKTNDSESEEF